MARVEQQTINIIYSNFLFHDHDSWIEVSQQAQNTLLESQDVPYELTLSRFLRNIENIELH